MTQDLDQVRKIFLDEVDEDVRADNEEKIKEWEQGLIHNEALLSWKEHDLTKAIAHKAKDTFKELGLLLASNRALTDEQRRSLWGKQDAMQWFLSLTEQDPKGEIERIETEIKTALNATN